HDFMYAGLPGSSPSLSADSYALADMERNHIAHVLHRYKGNKSEAARALGIDRKTLREKIKRYGLSD
ncbi:MAG: helix-turn-helix domain-containing protein, partial [Deltaproteobacteria bacterium]|nr:helix-turn-helix domain-containing protein [Deltaproteobacteria bacterium]